MRTEGSLRGTIATTLKGKPARRTTDGTWRKVVVCADFFRVPFGSRDARHGFQNNTARWFHRMFDHPITSAFGSRPQLVIWDDRPVHEQDKAATEAIEVNAGSAHVYDLVGRTPSELSWVGLLETVPSDDVIEHFRPIFEGCFVVGFELSTFQRRIFDALRVDYVSLAIHPIRFADDYLFMIDSSLDLTQLADERAISQEMLQYQADLHRLRQPISQKARFEPNTLVLFGQVEVDAALIHDGYVWSVADRLPELADLATNYSNLYFKPHPYAANLQRQIQLVSRIGDVRLTNDDAYAILADPNVDGIAALTSSVLSEARFFDKAVHALSPGWKDRSKQPALPYHELQEDFWESVRSAARGKSRPRALSPARKLFVVPGLIKRSLNISWSDHGSERTAGHSGYLVAWGRNERVGARDDGRAMLVGGNWYQPTDDHCWANGNGMLLSFRLPIGAYVDFHVTLTVSTLLNHGEVQEVQIVSHGVALHQCVLGDNAEHTLQFACPARCIGSFGDVFIQVLPSRQNAPVFLDPSNEDCRLLSLQLVNLEVRPSSGYVPLLLGTRQASVTDACEHRNAIFDHGWSHAEAEGVWSEGRSATVRFDLSREAITDISVRLQGVSPFITELTPTQTILVYCSGEKLDTFVLDHSANDISIDVFVPSRLLVRRRLCELELRFVSPCSPSEAEHSVDTRQLAIFVKGISVDAIPALLPERDELSLANIYGPHRINTGLGVMSRNTLSAINITDTKEAGKIRATAINLNNSSHLETETGVVSRQPGRAPISIFAGDVTRIQALADIVGNSMLRETYKICYGAWELADFPDHLVVERNIDEYWGLSHFIAEGAARRMRVPVHAMPLPVRLHYPTSLTDRSSFGLPDRTFMFLFNFSVDSTLARKNPQAVLNAFLQAFPQGTEPVCLVFKCLVRQASGRNLEEYLAFKALVETDPRIFILEENMDIDRNAALYLQCDVFISLHRAEGFGLTMAEAMGYGKPTIGTAYSGNLDFMSSENSCLVDYELVEMAEGDYHNQRQRWAEADTEMAAGYMRRLFSDRQFYERIGRMGKSTIHTEFSLAAVGTRLNARLNEIRGNLS